jgi:hypothetical protein
MSPNVLIAFSFSHPFLMALGDVSMGWMLLQRAIRSISQLANQCGSLEPTEWKKMAQTNKKLAFYHGQFCTAKFFIHSELPVTMGKFDAIAASDDAAVEILDASF